MNNEAKPTKRFDLLLVISLISVCYIVSEMVTP